jgi:hypothetical protein
MTRDVNSLGRKRFDVTPDRLNIFAGVIISLLFIGGGIFLLVFLLRDVSAHDVFAVVLGGLLGIGSVVFGTFVLITLVRQLSIRAAIHKSGFVYKARHRTEVVAWEDVAAIHENVAAARPKRGGLWKYMISDDEKQTSGYLITRHDGEEIDFKVGVMWNADRLRLALREASRAHSIPWKLNDPD